MKTLFTLIIASVLFFNTAKSQITLTTGNALSFGNASTSINTLNIYLHQYNNLSVGFKLDKYMGMAYMDPFTADAGELGRNKRFYNINTYRINSVIAPTSSDEKIKENFSSINDPIGSLKKIKAYKYDLKPSFLGEEIRKDKKNWKDQLGVIAQELELVYPSLVFYDSITELYSVNYIGLIPVLVEAIKAQQNQIEALKEKSNSGNNKSATINTDINSNSSIIASLSQNAPNPFNESTVVGYYLSESINKAILYVYNMNGLQLKAISIQSKGSGSVTINGSELQPGMYLYTLIADGKEIDTKRMILTE